MLSVNIPRHTVSICIINEFHEFLSPTDWLFKNFEAPEIEANLMKMMDWRGQSEIETQFELMRHETARAFKITSKRLRYFILIYIQWRNGKVATSKCCSGPFRLCVVCFFYPRRTQLVNIEYWISAGRYIAKFWSDSTMSNLHCDEHTLCIDSME